MPLAIIRPYPEDASQSETTEQSSPRARHAGGTLAGGLTLVAVVVFAAATPLLPSINLKVDATVIATVILALASYIRGRLGGRLGRSSLDAPALAFLLVGLLATIFSINWFLSFFPSNSRGEGLVTYVAYIAMALAVARLNRRQIGAVVTAVLISGSIIGAIALAQYFGVDVPFRAGFRPVTSAQYFGLDVKISPGLAAPNLFGRRSYGTLGNPVFLAGYVTLLLPVGMALAVQAKGKVWWVYAAASTLLYGALVGSQTRAAWIACAGAAVLLLGLLPKSPSVYRRLVMLGAVFAAVTAVMVLGSPEALGTRAASTFDTGDHSLQARLYMWRQTIPLIMERPALGWGFSALWGRFPVGTPEYLRVFGYTINAIDSPHNELLHVAFATGLIGLGAYLWVWAVIATSLRSMLRSPEGMPRLDVALIASLAAYLVWLQLAWSHIGPAHIFWIFAGVAVALRPSGDHREGVTNQV